MLPARLYSRTPKGTLETRNRASALSGELAPVLKAVDGRATAEQLAAQLDRDPAVLVAALRTLEQGGYIEPAPDAPAANDELDFTAPDAVIELEALAESRRLAEQDALARANAARRAAAAATAPAEAQAHARAESEAQARAHAEAHARAMVEAQLKATSAALARAQALARDEAQARARVTADLQAREAGEAQARADAAAQARADAEHEMRAELARLRNEARQAIAAADARAAEEREAREAAEARVAGALEKQRKAHAAARAATHARLEEERAATQARLEQERAAAQARVAEERAAREAAEARMQAELEARRAHEAAVAASAEKNVQLRVTEELRAREAAEREEDAQRRKEAARRARLAAAARVAGPAPQQVLKPRRRGHATTAKIAAGALAAVALAGVLALPRIPLDAYQPRVEKTLAAALGQPVRIARMQYRLLPAPELVLDGVTVGTSYGSRVEQVLVGAWPWNLLADSPHADTVVAAGVTLDREGAAALPALLETHGRRVHASRIRFDSVRLPLQDLDLKLASAVVKYDGEDGVAGIELASGGARFTAAPLGGGAWRVALDAHDWKPPLGTLKFEALSMNGVVADRRLRSATLEGQLAGGTLTGTLAADWRGPIRAEARVQLAKAQLDALLAAFTSHFSAHGTVTSDGQLTFQAATLGRLIEAPRGVARFSIDSGELVNVDILRALQQVSAQGVQGGRTRFERIDGTLDVAEGRYRYRQIQLSSGAMSAAGDVDVGAGGELGGRVTAGVNTPTRTAIRGVLSVRGTLVNPVLKP